MLPCRHCQEPPNVPTAIVVGSVLTCVLLLVLVLLSADLVRVQRQTITTQKLEINRLLLARNTDDIVCAQWLLKSNIKQVRDRICTYAKEPK